MGWKNVKEAYKIGHIVHVRDNCIMIGSAYVTDLIVINQEGEIVKGDRGFKTEDLDRYITEMHAAPATLKRLVKAKDSFDKAIPVYTYKDAEIITEHCEELGFPNVTHEGNIQYNNTYSSDRAEVIEWMKRNAEASVELWQRRVEEDEKRLAASKESRDEAYKILAAAREKYPD